MHKSILISAVFATGLTFAGVASARVVVDTGQGEPYFKVEGKRATPAEAFRAAGENRTVEKCTAVKGNFETADGSQAGTQYRCKEVELHITTKGNPSWKTK